MFLLLTFLALTAQAHDHTSGPLDQAVTIASSLYQGTQALAIEARGSGSAVQVNILSLNGATLNKSTFQCPVETTGVVTSCNGRQKGAANPQFAQMLESIVSLPEALETAGGEAETIYFTKAYKRPNGAIWARVEFVENQKNVGAIFNCHQHGPHYDCHYQSDGTVGPDEPLLP